MDKSKLNKYEKSMLGNLTIIKAGYIAVLLLNIFLPIVSSKSGDGLPMWGHAIVLITQLLVLLFHTLGLLGSHAIIMGQPIFMGPLLGSRFAQFLIMLYFWQINWFPYGLVLALDVAFTMMLLLDKSSYEYIRVSAKDEEESLVTLEIKEQLAQLPDR